jgi:mono/diheme cytochrome c family protein
MWTHNMLLRVAAVLISVGLGGCGDSGGTTDGGADLAVSGDDLAVTAGADFSVSAATAARGDELVNHLLFCGSCHTTPDAMGKPSTNPTDFLAGGKGFTVTIGPDMGTTMIYAPNLTPDPTTGLGLWTAAQIKDAITKGVDNDGTPLWPTMPYARFANLTDDDAASIALYLQSVTARTHSIPEDTAHPSQASAKIDFSSLPHTTLSSTDATYSSAERGRYLSNLGCVSCHSPNGAQPLGLDVSKAYAGGKSIADGPIIIQSSNLTPDATGLSGWTVNDVVQTLKTDLPKGVGTAKLCAPMAGGPNGFGGLTDADLTDIGQFLTTLAPIVNGPFSCPDGGL